MFANVNMGDPTKWTVCGGPVAACGPGRELAERARSARPSQPTPRNKFNLFWDQQIPCQGAGYLGTDDGMPAIGRGRDHLRRARLVQSAMVPRSRRRAPEVGTYISGYGTARAAGDMVVSDRQQAPPRSWLRDVSQPVGRHPQPGSPFTTWCGVTEQCTARTARRSAASRTCNYRSGTYRQNLQGTFAWRGSATYVTGARA